MAQFSIAGDGSLTALIPAVATAPGTGSASIALSPNGLFAYLGCNAGAAGSPVGQYNVQANGTLTALNPASVAAGNSPVFVAVDLGGNFVYVSNSSDNTVSQFAIGGGGQLMALNPATVSPGGANQIAFALK